MRRREIQTLRRTAIRWGDDVIRAAMQSVERMDSVAYPCTAENIRRVEAIRSRLLTRGYYMRRWTDPATNEIIIWPERAKTPRWVYSSTGWTRKRTDKLTAERKPRKVAA